jgi:hypothetical protein
LNKTSKFDKNPNETIQTISVNQENLNFAYVASNEALNTGTKNVIPYESYINNGFNLEINNRLASASNFQDYQEEKFSI